MKTVFAVLVLVLLTSAAFCSELRGIWINSDMVPMSDKAAVEMVREYHRAGFNLLFPEMICRGYAVYPSHILQRDPRFVEKDDVLKTLISEAHRLGMEVHPWVWCFRAGYTKDKGAIITNNPGWTDCSKLGDTLSVNGGMWVSPFIPECREFMLSLYEEIARKYDIDGFHLDYIRYEIQQPLTWGYNKKACDAFAAKYGRDPHDVEYMSQDYLSWVNLRAAQLDTFVQEASLRLKRIKPHVIVSAAVAADPEEARYMYCQNWGHWADNGWVDMIIPMTYTTSDQRFAEMMHKQLERIDKKVYTCVGIGSLNFTANEPKNIDQINMARNTSYMGQALFASQYYTETLGDLLSSQVWNKPAGFPYRSCEDSRDIIAYRESHGYVPNPGPALKLPAKILPVPEYTLHKATEAIAIDGAFDEADWANAPKAAIEYNTQGEKARVSAYARALWDDEGVIIGFWCEEPYMNELKDDAVKKDDPTFYDDSVEVFLNMQPGAVKYNHFSVNTLNTQFEQQIYNSAWNKNWTSAVVKNEKGWTAEMKIPFAELSVPVPHFGDKWKLNFVRNRCAGEAGLTNLCWAVTYGSFHNLERFGIGVFAE